MVDLPHPDQLAFSFPKNQTCVITADQPELTAELIKSLSVKGWTNIVVLLFSHQKDTKPVQLPKSINTVSIQNVSDTAIGSAVTTIRDQFGQIGGFIHLHSSEFGNRDKNELFPTTEKDILKQVFFLAKHLKTDLTTSAATSNRSFFMVVTQIDGKFGLAQSDIQRSVAGGYFGLVKTINVEWESVFCRIVDMAPGTEVTLAARLITAEIHDPNSRIVEVAFDTNANRRTLTAERESINNLDGDPISDISDSSVFLVSGGAKGVTASCVKELSKTHRCRFILLGRSEFNSTEPDWAKGIDDETELKKRCMTNLMESGEKPTPMKIMAILKPILASREIGETLSTLTSNGSQVAYVSVDITDIQTLKTRLSAVTQNLGSVTGLIHGAGVLADKLIENKTDQDYDAVFSTKINGLEALLHVINPEQLKHVVLFSSAAGFYGNEAQSDYATANEVLNKFSHAFKNKYPDCHIVSINWGPWDGGMVTPELKRLFQERNIAIIPVDIGSRLMTNELSVAYKDVAQVVVGNSMIVPKQLTEPLNSYQIKRLLTPSENPFLSDHQIGKEPVLPIIAAVAWMADSCEGLYPGYRAGTIEDIRVLKGLVFSDVSEIELFVDLIEKNINRESGSLQIDVNVSSLNPSGKPIFHYSASITLQKNSPVAPTFQPDLSTTQKMDATPFYSNGTLFHGPAFQIVKEQLNRDDAHITLRCEVANSAKEKQGQFPVNQFNYFSDDADLQAILIWVRQSYDAGSLPLSIRKVETFEEAPFGAEYFITAKIESTSSSQVIATVINHDRHGKIYTRMTGAAVAVSKNLNEKFLNH